LRCRSEEDVEAGQETGRVSPLFTGYAAASLFDTQYGMLLVYVALTIPFAFFVVRGHMTGLPNEVREAASLGRAG